jgi:tetratricopeptide (TPR) repeat protein
VVGKLAQALYQLDRLDEADAAVARAAGLGASDDAITQMLWRQAKAKVLARRNEPVEAERLAREAIAIGAETEMPDSLGDAHSDLGEVLILGGRADEARADFERALALYERKGNLVMAGRVNARLRELLEADSMRSF